MIAYVHQEEPGKSTPLEADTHSEVGVSDLLEVSLFILLPIQASPHDR